MNFLIMQTHLVPKLRPPYAQISTLFSNTCSLRLVLNVTDQVSCPFIQTYFLLIGLYQQSTHIQANRRSLSHTDWEKCYFTLNK